MRIEQHTLPTMESVGADLSAIGTKADKSAPTVYSNSRRKNHEHEYAPG